MSERVRSILAVAVLTIAIWVWADLEQTKEGEATMTVLVTVPAGYIVRSVQPERLTVQFTGPLGEIDKVKTSPDLHVCRFNLNGADLKSGRLVLQARDGFAHWSKRLDPTRITNDSEAIPDGEVHVLVDRLVSLQVRVEPQVSGAVATAATAQPPEVTARVAESELQGLPNARRFALAPVAVTSIPEDLQVKREVPLDLHLGGPEGINATFDPPIVTVTARLESRVVQATLENRFPILISAAPEILNRYRLVFQPEVERWVELEVEGPGPDVDRLKRDLQNVRVELVLTEDDKPDPGSWLPRKPVVLGLPPSVKLTKPLPTINFNLEKRSEKPPPA